MEHFFSWDYDRTILYCHSRRRAKIQKFHRQPVIIQKSQINNYFNLNNNAVEFLNNINPPKLKFEISTDVNNPAKNDPSIINPVNK